MCAPMSYKTGPKHHVLLYSTSIKEIIAYFGTSLTWNKIFHCKKKVAVKMSKIGEHEFNRDASFWPKSMKDGWCAQA